MKKKRDTFDHHFDNFDYESEFDLEFEQEKNSRFAAMILVLHSVLVVTLFTAIWFLIKGVEMLWQIL